MASAGALGTETRAAAGFTGVLPPSPGFTGVVPPPGFSGIIPSGDQPWTGPNLSPLLVKEAVINLRQAFVAQGGKLLGIKEKKEEKEKEPEPEPDNLFTVLGLKRVADEDAIKKSYRKLVLMWHPDKHPTDRDEAEEKIRKINNAYETLGNPVKREGYLQMLDAIERKKKNLKLDTSFIQPRMSIPKEFMLCPLGHPDKFVRVVNNEFLVQTREDVRLSFNEFFSKAKFTLWWLPEVNNMCRFRTAESATLEVPGGMFLNFTMDGAPTVGGQMSTKDADCILRANEDPRFTNLIAVASPFSPGAFRFEGAFWPGHYLSYRSPGKVCMSGLVDEVKDITDFYLVDYTAAYKTMTVDEALLGPVTAHGSGDWVKLSDLRADLSVRNYFQSMLKSAVWNNREFEDFFEGHYEQWEFDKKRASVRPRSAAAQLEERMKREPTRQEVAKLILKAGEELGALPVPSVQRWLQLLFQESAASPTADHGPAVVQPPAWQGQKGPAKGFPAGGKGGFGKPGFLGKAGVPPFGKGSQTAPAGVSGSTAKASAPVPAASTGPLSAAVVAAVRKLLATMAAVCTTALEARSGEVATLEQILALRQTILNFDFSAAKEVPMSTVMDFLQSGADKAADKKEAASDEKAVEKQEVPLAQLREEAVKALAGLVSQRLAKGTEKLEGDLFTQVLQLPLTWKLCVEKLCELALPLLEEPKPAGAFLEMLSAACKVGKEAEPLAEAIGRREMQALALAQGEVAAKILLALVEGGVLLKDACLSLKAPVLDRLPLPDLVRIVAVLGSSRPDDENLRPALETRIKPPMVALSLAKVPASDLLGLVRASRKSPLVEELVLDAVAAAASLALKAWSPKDAMELAMLLASSRDFRESVGSQEVYTQAAEAVSSKGTSLQGAELFEAVLAFGKVGKAQDLLKVVAKELSENLADVEQAQLLPLTEIFITLGAESEALSKLVDFWIALLGDKEKAAPRVDQVARLAEVLAPVLPNNERLFQAVGEHLECNARQLTNSGRTAIASAFPGGGGPDFPAKASLLSAVEASLRRRSRSRDKDRGRGGAAEGANNNHGERERERPREREPKVLASADDRDGRRRDGRREERERAGREDREERGRDRPRERPREEPKGREEHGREDRARHDERGRSDRDRDRGRERERDEPRRETPRRSEPQKPDKAEKREKREREEKKSSGRKGGGMRAFSDDVVEESPERDRKKGRR